MRRPIIASLFTAALGVSACAYYDDYGMGYHGHRYGDYRYEGASYAGWSRAPKDFRGSGAALLDPWLVQTKEGRALVAAALHAPSDQVSPKAAHRANAEFRRFADRNHDLRLTDEEIRIALVHAEERRF